MRLEIYNLRTTYTTPAAQEKWSLIEFNKTAEKNKSTESTIAIHNDHISIENKLTGTS